MNEHKQFLNVGRLWTTLLGGFFVVDNFLLSSLRRLPLKRLFGRAIGLKEGRVFILAFSFFSPWSVFIAPTTINEVAGEEDRNPL